MVSPPPAVPSIVMRDIDSLSSSVLDDLGAIFRFGPLRQIDPEAVVTSSQSSVVEGPMREADLELETTANTGLGDDLVVEVGSNSISEDSYEAIGSIPTIKVATLETSTPLSIGGHALLPVKGEDASRAASSFMGPFDEIV